MNNEIIKGEKISFKKNMMVMWGLTAILVIVFIIVTLSGYLHYREGQKKAVELTILAHKTAGLDDLDGMDPEGTSILESIYYDYNPIGYNYSSYLSEYEKRILEQKQKENVEGLRKSLTILMNQNGYYDYDSYMIDTWFEHHNYFQFVINDWKFQGKPQFYIVFCTLLLVVSVSILYTIYMSYNKNLNIEIIDDKIIYNKLNKRKQEFLVKDIKSIEETPKLKGIKISGNGIKCNVRNISNAKELKEILLEKKSKYKDDVIINKQVEVVNQITSADELLKYKQLLDAGAITEEEYNKKKEELLK